MKRIMRAFVGAQHSIARDPIFVFGPYVLIGLTYVLCVSYTTVAVTSGALRESVAPLCALWGITLCAHPLAQSVSLHTALHGHITGLPLRRCLVIVINRFMTLCISGLTLAALLGALTSATYWLISHGATTTGLLCQVVGLIAGIAAFTLLRFVFSYVLMESLYGTTWGILALPMSIQRVAKDLPGTSVLSVLGFIISTASSVTIVLSPYGFALSDLVLAYRWSDLIEKKLEDESAQMR